MRGEIFEVLKQAMKARGMRYRDLGRMLGLSEPSIKRMFSERDCKLSRLWEICEILGVTLSDLEDGASRYRDEPVDLAPGVELALAEDPSLFAVFILLREGLDIDRIRVDHGLERDDLFLYVRDLERLGLAEVGLDSQVLGLERDPIRFRQDGPLASTHAAVNLGFLRQCLTGPHGEFLTVSRRLRPETMRLIQDEMRAFRTRIAAMARQDQLLSKDDELTAFKWSCGMGPVRYSDLLKVHPHRKRATKVARQR